MENILVSVVVIAYNSEKTILETLDSIEKQTYKNFEVIICDDSSQDNTIKICTEWKTKQRIKNVIILESTNNEGTVKNINKGLKKVNGKWIKLIAADDILVNDCIEKNLNFINKNKNINICFSKIEKFYPISDQIIGFLPKKNNFFKLTPKEQYKKLQEECLVPAPSSFIKKDIFQKYGYFDERIPMIEDWPYWLKITSLGEKLYYFDEVTAKYRIGDTLSNNMTRLINYNYLNSKFLIYNYYLKNEVNFFLKYHYLFEYVSQMYLAKIFNNKRNKFSLIIFKYIKIFDFYFIYLKLKEFLKKEKNEQ